MYRFLFSSKWLGYLLLAAIFASACVFLGRWQMDRRAETLAEIDRVVTNYSATPIPFADAREQFNELDPGMEWTQVELRGTYLSDGQRVVRVLLGARAHLAAHERVRVVPADLDGADPRAHPVLGDHLARGVRGLWMSLDAPVEGSWNTISSAARPPMA